VTNRSKPAEPWPGRGGSQRDWWEEPDEAVEARAGRAVAERDLLGRMVTVLAVLASEAVERTSPPPA
jgi:hypothetical protein